MQHEALVDAGGKQLRMLAKDLRQMLAEALRIGHARCVVLFTIERHTDTLSSGWFHGAVSPYGAVCYIHSMGQRWNHPIVCTDSSPTTKSVGLRIFHHTNLLCAANTAVIVLLDYTSKDSPAL